MRAALALSPERGRKMVVAAFRTLRSMAHPKVVDGSLNTKDERDHETANNEHQALLERLRTQYSHCSQMEDFEGLIERTSWGIERAEAEDRALGCTRSRDDCFCVCPRCTHESLRQEYGESYDTRCWSEREEEERWRAANPTPEPGSGLSDIFLGLYVTAKIGCFVFGVISLFSGAIGPGLALLVIGCIL